MDLAIVLDDPSPAVGNRRNKPALLRGCSKGDICGSSIQLILCVLWNARIQAVGKTEDYHSALSEFRIEGPTDLI